MSVPWLSILIPVYNVKPYLDACLQSILTQMDSAIEIIALDDQSSDDSLQHLQLLAANSAYPIKILQHEQNRGLSAARNTLVKHARGEYIWFLDSDDALHDGAIASLRQIVQRYGPDLIMCDYELWSTDELLTYSNRNKYVQSFGGPANQLLTGAKLLFRGLYRCGKLHAWSKISRRYLWETNLQFPEGKYFEDMVTMPQLAFKVASFYYCPAAWVRYRQRHGSILSIFTEQKIEHMLQGIEGVWDVWKQRISPMDFRSRYFFIRYCVKVYLFAVRESRRIGSDFCIDSPGTRSRLFGAIGVGRKGMIKYYLLNGDFFRLIRTLSVLA